jgi:nucleotide-binding universal stress UspA family protein
MRAVIVANSPTWLVETRDPGGWVTDGRLGVAPLPAAFSVGNAPVAVKDEQQTTLMIAVGEWTDPAVLELGGALADEAGAAVVLAHAVEVPPYLGSDTDWQAERERALRRASENLHWAPGHLPDGLDVRARIELGSPFVKLGEMAREERADVMVLGGPSGDAGGSNGVARAVIEEGPCPVLVVPRRPARKPSTARPGLF